MALVMSAACGPVLSSQACAQSGNDAGKEGYIALLHEHFDEVLQFRGGVGGNRRCDGVDIGAELRVLRERVSDLGQRRLPLLYDRLQDGLGISVRPSRARS